MMAKRLIAKVYAEYKKDGLYAGEESDVFVMDLQEYVEKASKGFVYNKYSLKDIR